MTQSILNKNYSMTVIGESAFSYLLAIELLEKKTNVLLLEDDRLQYGQLYSEYVTTLDEEFLKTWGEDQGIDCLIHINQFLNKRELEFCFQGRRLLLGQNPAQNLFELYRKFPELFPYKEVFSPKNDDLSFLVDGTDHKSHSLDTSRDYWSRDHLDQDFATFYQRLGQNAFRFRGRENVTLEFFYSLCPERILVLFHLFKGEVKKNSALASFFIYFFRCPFQKVLSAGISDHELFHLFVSLTARLYSLDSFDLKKDLSLEFEKRGGHFKKTRVREWKFYLGSPWSLELASFEGIFHPEKVVLLGTQIKGLPILIQGQDPLFCGLNFSFSLEEKEAKYYDKLPPGRLFYWCRENNLATDIPILHFEVIEGEMKGVIVYRNHKGTKVEFIHRELREKIREAFQELFPSQSIDNEIHFWEEGEVFLDHSFRYQAIGRLKRRELSLRDYSSPQKGRKLKNVDYFGPLNGRPYGLLGHLVDLKEAPKYY